MPDPDFGKITDTRLQQLRQRIGVELDPDNFEPVDPLVAASWRPEHTGFNRMVTPDGIRHFVNGYGDDNPLYCDEHYAAETLWKGIIAPPTFVWSMFLDPFSAVVDPKTIRLGGGDEPPRRLRQAAMALLKGDPLRGVGALQSRLDYEFYRPLRPGDRLFTKKALLGVEDKPSSWGGRAVHVTWGLVSWNQHRELVHFQRGTWVRAERRNVDGTKVDGTKEVQPSADPYTDQQLAEIDLAYENETRRGREARRCADVVAGEPLPEHVKGPLRLTDIILWHAGFGQAFPTRAHRLGYQTRKATPGLFSPDALNVPDIVQRMHWDPDWARKVGAAQSYDYGALRETWLAQLALDWAGDSSWLSELSVQHRKFNYIGDTTWLRGAVAGSKEAGDRHQAVLDLRCENQRGLVTSTGTAIVALPGPDGQLAGPPERAGQDPIDLLRAEIDVLARTQDTT